MLIDNKKRYLMIVESPNKVKTITEILRSLGYSNIIVKASVGHVTSIKDSGVYNMGIDPDKDFKIDFKISDDKKDVVFKLKEQIKLSDFVILATDGDREGEAIAWSLKKFLNIPDNKYCRITYHEITKQAIQKALDNSTLIDNQLVEAAHTRSCLDKIVGYRLSPLARQELRAKSVGRCQSAGLKLIVDREKEIIDFKPELYYELYLNFKKNNNDFKAKYIGDNNQDIVKLPSKKVCDDIAKECKDKDYTVMDITNKEITKNTPLPSLLNSGISLTNDALIISFLLFSIHFFSVKFNFVSSLDDLVEFIKNTNIETNTNIINTTNHDLFFFFLIFTTSKIHQRKLIPLSFFCNQLPDILFFHLMFVLHKK